MLPGMRFHHILTAALVGTGLVNAQQVPPILPYARTLDLMVVDSSYDGVWRLADLNQDGDFHDAGEILSFYDDAAGSITLTNPNCIATANDGTVYIGDSTVDVIVALRDNNGDGDAVDAGEHRVFFDSSANASGITMASIQGLKVDALGRVFAAVSNAGGGTDIILLLEDGNMDGDANDLGEATDYCTIPNVGTATGDSIPTRVAIAPDATVYYTEVGSTGVLPKGVYKLTDSNNNGNCNDPGEVTLFWQPPAAASPFYWGLAIDQDGYFYVTDHSTNEQVWRGKDLDDNGTIDPSEENLYYSTSASTWWGIAVRDDGALLLCEDQTPDRVIELRDLNSDGDALDPGEANEAYNDTVTGNVRPRGAAFWRAPLLSVFPSPITPGQSTTFTTETTQPQQLVAVFFSVGLAGPTPLPPFGQIEIDASGFVPLGFGLSDATNLFALPFMAPNMASAIGTYGVQSWCGDNARFFLSNGAPLTVN